MSCTWRARLPAASFFEAPAAAMPVLLDASRIGGHAEARQLRPFAQAAFQFGESGEAGQADNVVPQWAGLLLTGQPTDHRAEERHTGGWAEVNDRGADILAGQRERFSGFAAELGVPRLV